MKRWFAGLMSPKMVLTLSLGSALLAGCAQDAGVGGPTGPDSPPSRITGKIPGGFTAIGSDPTTGATIQTDLDDYAPGEVVRLTGSGWVPNETVHLFMTEDPDTHADVSQDVQADGAGSFSLDFYTVQSTDIGATFTLTATGQTSASSATVVFFDANIRARTNNSSVTVNVGYKFFDNATDCTGTAPDTAVVSVSNSPVTLKPANSNQSVRATAPVFEPGGQVFVSWTNGSTTLTANVACLPGSNTQQTWTINYAGPTVTINQAAGQADPTGVSPINFTVVFSHSVSDFTGGDVTLSGTAGATTATVTGSGTTYNVAVSGMTQGGTVIASIPANAVSSNSASTSTDNTVTYVLDNVAPTVTIEQAAGQADPTGGSPINFTVTFSEVVTNFATGDVTLGGTAGATTATVTGSGTTYNVAVSGMAVSGSVIATIAAGVATDGAANPNAASTSTDNTVTYDNTGPTVTIEQAAGQADPTNTSPINFTVIFSEPVTDFATGDVTLGGTAAAATATVTGSGTTYNVAVTGMTGDGTVIASIATGVAHDGVGNGNSASTSSDNTVTYDITPPTVTINQAVGQADPTNASPINFTVVFSEPVINFATGDVTLGGTAGATTAAVTGGGTTYNVAVSGMTGDGTVIATITANKATDAAGNGNTASTSTDNVVTYDVTPPSVSINQAAGQADPTNSSPINFTVIFSEPVIGFATGDVTLSGTAGATTAVVSGSGTTYNVAVSGMSGDGTVIATVGASKATDLAGNANLASTSTDNTVTYDITPPTVTVDQAAGQADPTNASPINFTVVFSEPVSNFVTGDVTLGGTAGATTGTVTGSGATYNVAVTGMTVTGTVIATIAANKASDAAGNGNTASTSTDNTVTYDKDGPLTSNVAATNPVAINTTFQLTALVNDATTGNSNVTNAQYNLDGGAWTGGGTASPAFGTSSTVTVTFNVTIPTTGVYDVCVRGTDAAGNIGPATCGYYLAVYDPRGGFVTGGGWIDSPAGAYKADASLVGKANFGFVSKYLKGANTPSGDTEFQFKAGNLNFKSASYEWLVVAGARGQFKGSGTINGSGDYGFMLTAIDGQEVGGGGTDLFRMKIWNKVTGTVIYDNQIGDVADNAVPSTAVSGGSIVIHSK